MLSRFFIERPIFANVIAIVTVLIGGVALYYLPIEQSPDITPPTVQVRAVYPGANAQVVANTVAQPIEEQVNGVENMLYMSSVSSADGSYVLTVTFNIGTNLDTAQVLLQNRVAVAEPLLPEEVKRQGVTVKKQSSNILIVVSLSSPDDRYDNLFLSNYATLRLKDALARVKGIGEVTVFGAGTYSMRVWLDPEKLKARMLTTQDVVAAIQEQNVQVAAGTVGQPPSPSGVDFQYTVTVLGRLSDVQQFENIIVKTGQGTQVTRLKDVARVELGAQTYDQFNLKRGRPTANIGIFQLPGANALEVAKSVIATVNNLKAKFPEGLEVDYPLNTTKFVEASIFEVYKTLIEAGILVLIVILVFLQDWRAVLIPATTVPVTIIGAFAALSALGFSANMLTLFGLVLAIGIVVDDAIVIVENAAHHIERGLDPKPATIKAMSEVLGPIIGITLVLMAVFLPSAFLGGITGQLYRQFALTIASTAIISAINAVTLKPAQCALWLRRPTGQKNWFYRGFNRVYSFFEGIYVAIVRLLVRHVFFVMLLFVGLVIGTGYWYTKVPTGFFPIEDQGYILMAVQLPDAASQERQRAVMKKIDAILEKTDGVQDYFTIGGLSLLDNSSSSNAGTVFITFKPWEERLKTGRSQELLLRDISIATSQIKEAFIVSFPPPPIRGLGFRAGFQMQLEDKGDVGLAELQAVSNAIMESARGQSSINPASLSSTFRAGVPQLFVDVDREKVKALNIPLATVFNTLQAYLGSAYVNDFNKFGRTYQVRVQAEPSFRSDPKDIDRLELRNRDGAMIPISAIATVKKSFGPQIINRYNQFPTAAISGEPAQGTSSGDALRIMEEIADRTMPDSVGYDWTNMSFQEKNVGNQQYVIYSLAILLVYLVLAAQYESWLIPMAVLLVVPTGVLGAIAAVSFRWMDINLYTQIGIVLIIALASKNAILIVEFARDLRRHKGIPILEAAVDAARMRFRPILMTSFAFILGIVPLVVATGAGSGAQRALGTAVFGGMLASTFLAVFFVPVFFVMIQSLEEKWQNRGKKRRPKQDEPSVDGTVTEEVSHELVGAH